MRGISKWLAGLFVLLLTLTMIAVPVTAAAQASSSMGQTKGNAARTGEQPGPGLSGQPALRWSYAAPGDLAPSLLLLAPVMADGVIFVAADAGRSARIFRLDAKTGRELPWAKRQFGLDVGDMGGLNATSVSLFPLALADGILYVPTVTHFEGAVDRAELTAYDAKSGARLWRLNGYGVDRAVVPQPADMQATGNDLVLSPAIADGTIYVPVNGMSADNPDAPAGVLVAVDAHSGKVLWHTVADGSLGTPSVAAGGVYDGIFISSGNTFDSFTVAYDAKTGKQRWRAHVESVGQMPVVGGLVFTTTEDQIVALNADSGKVAWQVTAPAGTLSSPAVVDGTLFVTDLLSQQTGTSTSQSATGGLYALDAKTGDLRWSAGIDTVWFGQIAVASGVVYLSTGNQNQQGAPIGHDAALSAFAAGSGTLLWRFAPAHVGNRYGSPTIVGGVAYVVANTYVDAIGGGLSQDSPIATAPAASHGGVSSSQG